MGNDGKKGRFTKEDYYQKWGQGVSNTLLFRVGDARTPWMGYQEFNIAFCHKKI